MAVVGLIPARGGSKGVPGKNIAPCAGRPLLAYTCDAALASRSLNRVLLSTDSPGIAEVGRACGVEVPFLRPAELATDTTPSLPVMAHALDWLEAAGESVEALVLLQPTSPLRTSRHIDEAVDLLRHSGAATVVSVIEVPHRFHPQSLMKMEAGALAPAAPGEPVTRRQDLAPLYARNGPAVLVLTPEAIRSGRLYEPPTVGYVMDPESSLDIDSALDLELAGLALARRSSR